MRSVREWPRLTVVSDGAWLCADDGFGSQYCNRRMNDASKVDSRSEIRAECLHWRGAVLEFRNRLPWMEILGRI